MALKDRIKFGMALPHRAPEPIDMAAVTRVAQRAEALGFADLWVTENTVDHVFCFDPVVILTHAAAVTSRIRVGASVIVLPVHNPIHVAHQWATLDYVSNGRAILGVGLGRDNHYTEFQVPREGRVRRFREAVALIRALWSEDKVEYRGQIFQFDGRIAPRPVQQPLPIWTGVGHPDALRRTAKLADGWMGSGGSTIASFKAAVPVLRAELAKNGRDPARFPLSKRLFLSVHERPEVARAEVLRWFTEVYRNPPGTDASAIHGTPEQVRERLEEIVAMGADHLLLNPVCRYTEQVEACAAVVGLLNLHPNSEAHTMEFGASIFFTDYTISPAALAVALEQRGFASLWAAEHSHIPVPRRTPAPGGGELPKRYYDVMDPFVTLAVAAAATKTLKLATGICLVIQRDTIQTAKAVASLDQVSGGRFLFGIGGGWNVEEIESHGTVFATRMQKMREQIEAMKQIWTKSTAEYNGDIVKVTPMMTWPKPVQKPHPPILVGGAFPWAARRAIRYGDGWYPNASSGKPEEYMPRFRQMATEAGRDLQSLSVTIGGAPEDADQLKRFRDLGAAGAVVSLGAENAETLLPILDRWAGLIRQVNG